MKPPPTRYRVVEKGRRLVVIDSRTDAPVGGQPQGAPKDGSAFVTRSWYDEKAPRTVRLNYGARQRIKNVRFTVAAAAAVFVVVLFLFWPFSLILAVLLVQPKLHKQARRAVTGWIDGFDQAA